MSRLRLGHLSWWAAGISTALLMTTGCYGSPWQPHPPQAGEYGLPSKDNASEAPEESGFRPSGHIAYQPPLLPVQITVTHDLQFNVTTESSVVTPLGRFAVGGGGTVLQVTDTESGDELAEDPADVTQLFICAAEPGAEARRNCEGYRIGTGRRLRIEMDGEFVQYVEHNRQVVEAGPGAFIKVSDVGEPTVPGARGPAFWAIEEFELRGNGPDRTAIDLEQSFAGTQADLSYDHVTGALTLVNGAKISRLEKHSIYGTFDGKMSKDDYPNEGECLATEEEDWRTGFTEEDLDEDIVVSCVKTAEGDLGYVVVGLRDHGGSEPTGYQLYAVIWVR